MFKILIYDNYPEAMLINSYIQYYEDKYKIDFQTDLVTSYYEFDFLQNCSFDIAFINIDSSFYGFHIIEYLKKSSIDIIIITISSFYINIDKALELQVFQYLIRPIDKYRFEKNFNKIIRSCQKSHKYIAVDTKDKIYKINISDIIYISTQKHGSIIKTQNNLYLLNKKKPKEWAETIRQPSSFIYSHNSYLVNLQHVINFDKSLVTLSLKDGNTETVYMSQRKYAEFKKAFIVYLNENH